MTVHNQLFILGPELYKAVSWEEAYATAEGLKQCGLYRMPFPRLSLRWPGEASKNHFIDHVRRGKFGGEGEFDLDLVADEMDRDLKGKWPEDRQFFDWMQLSNWNGESNDSRAKLHHYVGPGPDAKKILLDGKPFQPGKTSIVKAGTQDGHSWPSGLHWTDSMGYSWGEFPRDIKEIDWTYFQAHLMFLIVLLATRNVEKEVLTDNRAKLRIGREQRIRFVTTTSLRIPKTLAENHESVTTGREVAPHLRRGHIRQQAYGPNLSYRRARWIEPMFINADKDWIQKRNAYNVGGLRPAIELDAPPANEKVA